MHTFTVNGCSGVLGTAVFRDRLAMKRFAGKVAVVTGSTQGWSYICLITCLPMFERQMAREVKSKVVLPQVFEQDFRGKSNCMTNFKLSIGFSIARRLGLDGAQVIVSSRKQSNVDEAVKKLRAENINVDGVVCHVAKAADRESLVNTALQKYGRLDILVNNAGMNPHFGSLLDVSESIWDKIFDVNVKAGFLLSKLVVPHMEKLGGGSIIFNSSISGYVPFLGIAAYSVSKTAVIGLVHALAMTCGPLKIRVNGIAPGIVQTEFSKALWDDGDAKAFHAANIPLGRLATADDCAGAVSFLCSDEASYITGEVIMITGGINARL